VARPSGVAASRSFLAVNTRNHGLLLAHVTHGALRQAVTNDEAPLRFADPDKSQPGFGAQDDEVWCVSLEDCTLARYRIID
jgi:hypothetical protein